jgi:hypothetical protein
MFSPGALRITNFSLCFFYWQIFAKLWPRKYDFDSYKGFVMEKMTQIRQILKIFFFQIDRFFVIIYSNVLSRIDKDFLFYFFLLSCLVCSQNWLKIYSLDDHHFGYITKSLRAVFLLLPNFHQIPTWKMRFWPIGRIFHGKMAQIRQIYKIK